MLPRRAMDRLGGSQEFERDIEDRLGGFSTPPLGAKDRVSGSSELLWIAVDSNEASPAFATPTV